MKEYYVTHYTVREVYNFRDNIVYNIVQSEGTRFFETLAKARLHIIEKYKTCQYYENSYPSPDFFGVLADMPQKATKGLSNPYSEFWQVEANDDLNYPSVRSADSGYLIFVRHPKEKQNDN